MSDVGLRVTLDGLDEAKQGLGTLEEGLAKLAARSPENARKLAEVTAAVTDIGAAHDKIADEVEDANTRIGASSKRVTDLEEMQAAAAQRLQEAYEKLVASQEAAGKAVPFSATGEAIGPAPTAGPGRLLAPGAALFGSTEDQRMMADFYASLPPRIKKVGDSTKQVKDETVELSKEVQGLVEKYNPLETRLRQLTKAQEEFRNVSQFPKSVSGDAIINVEKGLQAEIDKTKEAMKGASDGADDYGASLVNLALRYVAPIALAHQLISVMHESTVAGREAELQNIKLNTVLQATGMVAGFTGAKLSEMAEGLEKTTAIDSEKIKQGITTLLTFKNVQGDMFERALKLSLDYSRLTGGDVVSATRLFGRALESPEHGFQMLTRTLGRASDAEIKFVRDMEQGGNVIGAQIKIVEFAEGKMLGLAKAIGESAVSAADKFSIAWNNLMKELAKSPEDPTGAGGGIYGAMATALDFFTRKQKEAREVEMRELMKSYGEDSKNFKFSLETRQKAFAESEKLRKALGIKTEQELAIEKLQIVISQAQAAEEAKAKFYKQDIERQIKQIDTEISLNKKSIADKVALFELASKQEGLTEAERLEFLAKASAAKKEMARMTSSELDAVIQLNSVASKGRVEALSAELALGQISKKEYEERKTEQDLLMNEIQLELTERKLSLLQIWDQERKILLIKKEGLEEERKQIVARGTSALALDKKKQIDDELKVQDQLGDIQQKTAKTRYDTELKLMEVQDEKLLQLNTEISLISATAVQRDVVLTLQKLDLDYTKQKREISERNFDVTQRQLDILNKQFEKQKTGLAGPELQALNVKFAKEVGEIVAKNNEEYQEQLDVITAIYDKSKAEIPGLIRLLDEQKIKYEDLKEAIMDIGSAFSSAFEDAILGGKSFRDILSELERDLLRIGTRMLVTKPFERWLEGQISGGSGGGGMFGGIMNWFTGGGGSGGGGVADFEAAGVDLFGNAGSFQHGGEFMVGGNGGIDSQFVGFKASPGERVTVETPGQQNRPGGRGGRSIVINGPLIAVSTPDAGSFNRYSGQLGADLFATLSNMSTRFR